MSRRMPHALLICLAILGAACGAASGANRDINKSNTPARDRFSGRTESTSGSYSSDSGSAHVYLHPRGSGTTRSLRMRVQGALCPTSDPHGPPCRMFDGTLTGTITQAASQNPDTGHAYKLNATGTLTGLGAVSASGTAQGTGFIARGRETLHLTLQNGSGSMTFQMHSPLVSGFTSP